MGSDLKKWLAMDVKVSDSFVLTFQSNDVLAKKQLTLTDNTEAE